MATVYLGEFTVRNAMTFDHVLQILGGLIPVLSALASFVNHVIRSRQAEGASVPPMLAGAGSVLNVGAINLDKAIQLARLLKEVKAEEKPADPPAAG